MDDKNSNVVIQVIDEGEGIPETEIGRMFEPFERITDPRAVIEGLGLGLAICKTIVEAHNGTITYQRTDSARNAKSVFQVTLPVAE